jgi:hypothetical protein
MIVTGMETQIYHTHDATDDERKSQTQYAYWQYTASNPRTKYYPESDTPWPPNVE